MGAKLQLVVDKDKGLDMAALLKSTDSIVPYVLAEVVYYPKREDSHEGDDINSLRVWTYQNVPGAFYLQPSQLSTDFRHADVTIKSPRSMRVGYLEIPRKEYPVFCEDVRKVFHIHSIGIKKEWSWIHSYENGAHKWVTFEQFIHEKTRGRSYPIAPMPS